jgi:hypothetical protein
MRAGAHRLGGSRLLVQWARRKPSVVAPPPHFFTMKPMRPHPILEGPRLLRLRREIGQEIETGRAESSSFATSKTQFRKR